RPAGRGIALAGAALAIAAGLAVSLLPVPRAAMLLAGIAAAAILVVTDAWLVLFVAAYPLQGISLFGVESFGLRLSHVFFLVAALGFAWRFLTERPRATLVLGATELLVIAFTVYVVCYVGWSWAPVSLA